MLEIKFAKLYDNVKTPSKRAGDAGYDIYPYFEEQYIVVEPMETVMISTGIKTAFDENFVAILKERGSTGTKGIGQRCGVIDSSFRGEWKVPITNHNDLPLIIYKGDIETTLDSYIWNKRLEITKEVGQVDWIDGHLQNMRKELILYPYEKAISQVLFLPVPETKWDEVCPEEVDAVASERGEGMLGSSGK